MQVRVILSRFPGGALAGVQPSDLSTAEETGPDTLLREGLRHVMDQSKESLLERERQFITMAIEVLEVLCGSCRQHYHQLGTSL